MDFVRNEAAYLWQPLRRVTQQRVGALAGSDNNVTITETARAVVISDADTYTCLRQHRRRERMQLLDLLPRQRTQRDEVHSSSAGGDGT